MSTGLSAESYMATMEDATPPGSPVWSAPVSPLLPGESESRDLRNYSPVSPLGGQFSFPLGDDSERISTSKSRPSPPVVDLSDMYYYPDQAANSPAVSAASPSATSAYGACSTSGQQSIPITCSVTQAYPSGRHLDGTDYEPRSNVNEGIYNFDPPSESYEMRSTGIWGAKTLMSLKGKVTDYLSRKTAESRGHRPRMIW